MTKLKLGLLADDKPVKIMLELDAFSGLTPCESIRQIWTVPCSDRGQNVGWARVTCCPPP